MDIKPTQKNEIFQILQGENLPLIEFKWTTIRSLVAEQVPKLNYKDGEFYITFDYSEYGEFLTIISPGHDKRVEGITCGRWDDVINTVKEWAKCLRREIDAPNLWEEFDKYQSSFSLTPSEQIVNENIPFNEVEKIIEALHSLESGIKEKFKLDEQQNQFVHSKLDYLEDAVKRLGRLDWVNLCIGTFITLAFQLAFNIEETKELGNLIKTFLGQYIPLITP